MGLNSMEPFYHFPLFTIDHVSFTDCPQLMNDAPLELRRKFDMPMLVRLLASTYVPGNIISKSEDLTWPISPPSPSPSVGLPRIPT